MLRERLHGEARLQLALARMEGYRIDKKAARFNEIVETAIRYGRCAEPFSESAAVAGLRDAIDCCIVGDPAYYAGGSCLSLVQDWMLVSDEPLRDGRVDAGYSCT